MSLKALTIVFNKELAVQEITFNALSFVSVIENMIYSNEREEREREEGRWMIVKIILSS